MLLKPMLALRAEAAADLVAADGSHFTRQNVTNTRIRWQ